MWFCGRVTPWAGHPRAQALTDIVIPVRPGAHDEPESLRYALRSIWHHVSGWERIWIIGHYPSWLDRSQIDHIASHQRSQRFRNISEPELRFDNQRANIEALLASGADASVIWTADDIYATRAVSVDEIEHYHRGYLRRYVGMLPEGGPYREGLAFALKILERWGWANPHNYATHTPAPLNLDELERVMRAAWAEGLPGGFMRPIYPVAAHTTRAHRLVVDPKLKTLDGHPDDVEGPWVSSDPTSYSVGALGGWLRARFWRPAPWELR
jgi:hypothetical protein